LVPTPVAQRASAAGLPVLTPAHLDAECRAAISALAPDIFVCFAYGHIFGPKFLAAFPLGGVNLHPSLLPRWRGPTPVPAAILAQDALSGVTVQQVALEPDAGAILAQEQVILSGDETGESLLSYLADVGADLLVKLLDEIAATGVVPTGTPQDAAAVTFCGQLSREDGRIDWLKSAAAIDAQVRAYQPWPGAWTTAEGEIVKVSGVAKSWWRPPEGKSLGRDSPVDSHESWGGCGGYPPAEREAEDRQSLAGAWGRLPPPHSPGTILGTDRIFGILVQTGDGVLGLTRLQRAGKKEAAWQDFLNGWPGFLALRLK
jgi:methionyl-tRNA formyltransferase